MKKLVLLVSILLVIILPAYAHAASLRLSPNTNTYYVGNTFILSVVVSSTTESLNAASGAIVFPPDKLEVVSISKNNSIFNFWPTEPVYSNGQGTVNFEGIILNPGFIGQTGQLLTITFRVKKVGTADIIFRTGAVLANNGQGTNILNSLGTARFTLKQSVDNQSNSAEPAQVATTTIEAINPPQIQNYPREIRGNEQITITGSSYPNSKVSVWFQYGDEITVQTINTNSVGVFTYISNRDVLDEGLYKFWITVTHESGIQSGPSERITIHVKPTIMKEISTWIMDALAIFAPVTILGLILAFVLMFGWYKFRIMKAHLSRKIEEADMSVHKSFEVLNKDAENIQMKNELREAEKCISKEIKNIKDI